MAEDTLPQWLHTRFGDGSRWFQSASWENLSADDQAYWKHEAAAVRRAVARNGFKEDPEPGSLAYAQEQAYRNGEL